MVIRSVPSPIAVTAANRISMESEEIDPAVRVCR